MTLTSIGDLAQSHLLRLNNTRLKSALDALTGELGSGRKADIGKAVRGDFRPLAALDRSIGLLDRFQQSVSEARLRAGTIQTVLGGLQEASDRSAGALTTAGTHGGGPELAVASRAARGEFSAAVAALNTRVAGSALFSGQATDRPALPDAGTLLAELGTLTTGATTAVDAAVIVKAYFTAPAGGFEAAYLGDPASLDPVVLGEGESVDPGPTALAPELRAALSGLAMGALLDGNLPGLAGSERGALARHAGEALFGAAAGLVTLRAQTGVAEERIERAEVGNAVQRTALENARSGITDADPFTTATELESVTAQLEILFSLTARVSQLSLSSFLR